MNPITPHEAIKAKVLNVPDFYIEVFNELILKNLCNNYSTVKYKEVIPALEKKAKELGIEYDRNIINGNYIEQIYRSRGWTVTTDIPAFNETYDGYYQFSIK
jgi:hypothetical protein